MKKYLENVESRILFFPDIFACTFDCIIPNPPKIHPIRIYIYIYIIWKFIRCNGLPLPAGMTETLFQALIAQVETRKRLLLTFQESQYAKIDMHPMWVDLLHRMEGAMKMIQKRRALNHDIRRGPENLHLDQDEEEPSVAAAPKLSITIAHDSTLMPMMAVLLGQSWNGAWTTYAGMLIFELFAAPHVCIE